ncbi:MAG: hypothetical protein FK732_02130 [Asgard group archaeon]|nr:hypothetical protein [Asgard group archaeon]
MKREIKLSLVITALVCNLVIHPNISESSDHGPPMCERFYLSGNEGNSTLNYRFFFTPDVLFNLTIISDQSSTSNITIEVEAEEEQNISALEPGETYNFKKYYPWTPILILYNIDCNITLDNLNYNCSGLIIYGKPSTNCTLFDTETSINLPLNIFTIGSFLIVLFTGITIVTRIRKKKYRI